MFMLFNKKISKRKLIVWILLFFGVFIELLRLFPLILYGFSLTGFRKLSQDRLTYECSTDYHVQWTSKIERCPNGDIYIGRKGYVMDMAAEIYNKDKYLIEKNGGFNQHMTITPIYLWRTLTFQNIGCEESKSVDYCMISHP